VLFTGGFRGARGGTRGAFTSRFTGAFTSRFTGAFTSRFTGGFT
jgi:hypothetical protein